MGDLSKSVKKVFLIIIGFFVLLFIIFLYIELQYTPMYSSKIMNTGRKAVFHSIDLYNQESYKPYGTTGTSHVVGGGTVPAHDIVDENGSIYISGDFYNVNYNGGDIGKEIYTSIHLDANFKNWINSNPAVLKGDWETINTLRTGLHYTDSSGNVNIPTNISDENTLNELSTGAMYIESLVTPANLGVPYIDKNISQNMFRWHLTKELMADDTNSLIRIDANNKKYLYYKGFRVYADEAQLRFNYITYNLEDAGDVSDFEKLTHIEAHTIKQDVGDERNLVMVVIVDYNVPVAYEGITPIRSLYKYTMDMANDVKGIGNAVSGTIPNGDLSLSTQEFGFNSGSDDVYNITRQTVYTLIK